MPVKLNDFWKDTIKSNFYFRFDHKLTLHAITYHDVSFFARLSCSGTLAQYDMTGTH